MNISGYKQVTYSQLQVLIGRGRNPGTSDAELAVAVGVKTTQTIKNALQKNGQKVSDQILSHLISIIGIDACVVWNKGARNYYVKNK